MHTSDHFSDEDWADFVRGVGDGHDAMRAHLTDGCHECAERHRYVRAVTDLARRDAHYEPPPSAVRIVEAAFDRTPPAGTFARVSQAMKLLFDSQLAAAPAGVRSGVSESPRRLVFVGGELMVELQLAGSGQLKGKVLIGQVTSRVQQRGDAEPLRVLLHSGSHVVAHAATNRVGEFVLEFEDPGGDLTLALGSERGSTIVALGSLSTRTLS
jgi:hypothetical protein